MQFIHRATSLVLCLALCLPFTGAGYVGVNYGTNGNNLPSPSQVAKLLLTTSLRYVKIYNADQATLLAFANTGIKMTVSVGNDGIPLLASSVTGAQAWVQTNVAAYMPATEIIAIAVGNEVFTVQPALAGQLVSAILNIHTALVNLKLDGTVKVSSPQSLGVLQKSYPPSSSAFQDTFVSTFKDLLSFHSQTSSALMVNAYPYFAYTASPANVSLNYALFQTDAGVTDLSSGLHYSNILDAQLDAVYTAMARVGYQDVQIVISETGWPSSGDSTEIGGSVANAQIYNSNLIKHIAANSGTPMRPNASINAYIFALFNENLKPGPGSERNYGLFNPDMTPVYNVGLTAGTSSGSPPTAPSPTSSVTPPTMAPPSPPPPPMVMPPTSSMSPPPPTTAGSPAPSSSVPPPPSSLSPLPATATPTPPTTSTPSSPGPSGPQGKTWCVGKSGAATQDLQNALNYACGHGGVDCSAIQPGAKCYNPNTLLSHATYAFNEYYNKSGRNYWNCFFGGTAVISITDPSYSGCTFS